MKQSSRISIVLLMLIISFSACKEDIYVDWKIKNEQWLENNKNQPGVITTASGLQYKVIYQGWYLNRQPNRNSLVNVKYTGKLIDGSTFDSSTSAIISLSQVVEGWKEGITKMNGGGNYILYIPSALGYDTVTTNTKIPPHSTLIFDVELLDSQN
jgi:FKBP-type peptidyl-prolyl cis-trans isomerase